MILILDRWEQSPAAAADYSTLQRFLEHSEEWHRCHVLIGLRPDHPAFDHVEDLELASPKARVYRLPRMHLDGDDEEVRRVLTHIRGLVPAARWVSDGALVAMIDGFPGFFERWTDDHLRLNLADEEDLRREADSAQLYR